jgi:hypothetical protein
MAIDDHPTGKGPPSGAPIDVWKDPEGVRTALEEIFESDFVRSFLDREAGGANEETRARMERQIPKRTLAWGYYRFGAHLLQLDSMRRAGIGFAVNDLAACEVSGLVSLDRARSAFQGRHPACSACGVRQQNRFGVECPGCGAKFQRKKP